MATTYAIPDGRVAMAATLYTGTDGVAGSVTGVGFSPDFVWVKSRSGANSHGLFDTVRGVQNGLFSNLTNAEISSSTYLTAFNSNGFSHGGAGLIANGSLVSWNWKAGGTAVSNTAGTITSSVSANTTAGFSVVTYTGTGANATVGHGLGVAPKMVIVKGRSTTFGWYVYNANLTSAAYILSLNTTDAQASSPALWNSTAPTSTVFSIGTGAGVNTSSGTYVAYCFAEVAGYSKFGSYTGNGSADGPFVFTNFRPRFILVKDASTAQNWQIIDTSRDPYNVAPDILQPNLSNAESAFGSGGFDILSNGFKIRTSSASINTSGSTMIYAAFAETAFKFSNAR